MKLSPPQEDALRRYEDLLREYSPRLGLISPRDVHRIRERHVDDCLRATDAFTEHDRDAYDLGSGAGLPGIVLAIVVSSCRFRLLEPRRGRAGFLELCVERLELPNVDVFAGPAEEAPWGPAGVVTARAFAPPRRTWRTAWPLLRPGGRLVYFAGTEALGDFDDPEPPGSVEIREGLANQGPLVIMARG